MENDYLDLIDSCNLIQLFLIQDYITGDRNEINDFESIRIYCYRHAIIDYPKNEKQLRESLKTYKPKDYELKEMKKIINEKRI